MDGRCEDARPHPPGQSGLRQARRFMAIANKKVIETTVGRVIFSEIWPAELGFLNNAVGKSQLGDLIWNCYKICGHDKHGGRRSTSSRNWASARPPAPACSIGIDDMIIPKEKRPGDRGRAEADRRGREAVSQGRHHPGRALQQDHRHLDALHRPDLERHVQDPGGQPGQEASTTRSV